MAQGPDFPKHAIFERRVRSLLKALGCVLWLQILLDLLIITNVEMSHYHNYPLTMQNHVFQIENAPFREIEYSHTV
jgi:hypothetical protein